MKRLSNICKPASFRYITCILFLVIHFSGFSQIRLEGFNSDKINPELFKKLWNAKWISVSDTPENTFVVCHFRKTFHINHKSEEFIIHISADNRYKLFVNGMPISLGPARCDQFNWNFETVDIGPHLKTGKNTLAVLVWDYGNLKPIAQMSFGKTELIVQGNSHTEEVVNTDDSWVCTKSQAYDNWESKEPVIGYYVAGPGELFDSREHLWGWETCDFDDSTWLPALPGLQGAIKGGVDYSGRNLVPTPIPPMEEKTEFFAEIRKCSGIGYSRQFLYGKESLIIPPNCSVELVLDMNFLTTGYLNMNFSEGKDAEITIGYAEAYFTDKSSGEKGNRNDIEGKYFAGYEDKIIADGGKDRSFCSLWWRTWRYVRVKVKTYKQGLIINKINGIYSAYPFINQTNFKVPEKYDHLYTILDIGWRTARLCANETYMDCPYYEQLQYFGDTRIQAMVSMYNTNDKWMVKNAIEQGRQSMVSDGFTLSRYPSNARSIIPSFSLWWICMGYDYWMYRGDEQYLKTLLPAYRSILTWFEQYLKPNNSLDFIPYWFFIDWADGFATTNGAPIRDINGDSALQDILYLIALDNAAKMEQNFGLETMSSHYELIADKIRSTFKEKYWDAKHNLFADTMDKRSFSQHVNILVILAGLTNEEDSQTVMTQILNNESLIQTTIYFKYYLNQALKKSGMGNLLLDNMQVWEDQMKLGLTTWAERPEPSRSDCHAWGASPNIEFYRILLGIDTDAPGFKRVKIAPALNRIDKISGSIPHPLGRVSVEYRIDNDSTLHAKVELPTSVEGYFVWKGKEYPLKEGSQNLIIR